MSSANGHSSAHPWLAGKRVAFTGRLSAMSRREAYGLVRRLGGLPVSHISRDTDLLVLGLDGWAMLPDGSISTKLCRAEALVQAGQAHTEILSEAVFLDQLGLAPHMHAIPRCDLAHAARVLGLDPAVAARCQQFGLLRSEAGHVDFQDLVSLRGIAGLLRQGLSPAAIANGLHKMARWLDTERPLHQVRLIAEGDRFLAELDGLRAQTDGQIAMDFEPNPRGAAVRLSAAQAPLEHEGVEAWLQWAGQCEPDRPEAAEEAYQAALCRQPDCVDAHLGMGRLAQQRDALCAAEAAYRRAIGLAPELALGWQGLATALIGQSRTEEAVVALRQCLTLAPETAQAYFHLAGCYERLQRPGDALVCWSRYLRLAPDGEQAEIARLHIAAHRHFNRLETL